MNDRFRIVGTSIAAATLALIVTVSPAFAAGKMYLDFTSTGSPSEKPMKAIQPTDVKSTNVEISSFQFGSGKPLVIPVSATAPKIGSQTTGAGAGKATLESMDATLVGDGQKLFDLAVSGKSITAVRLLIFKSGKAGLTPTYTAVMHDVYITSTDWTGKPGDKPTARVTLDYASIEIEKNTNGDKDDPKIPAGWNQVVNKSELSAP
jgi:type VI protein secretion system component Hcp